MPIMPDMVLMVCYILMPMTDMMMNMMSMSM